MPKRLFLLDGMALVYRALSDEHRLRILRLLHHGELYAQEIVERTGLHQSVVSRHLTFMKAVGLVNVRRQNNMKFYSPRGADVILSEHIQQTGTRHTGNGSHGDRPDRKCWQDQMDNRIF